MRSPPLPGSAPGFDPDAAPDEPMRLLAGWLEAAIAARVAEPRVMTLATVDAAGHPDARALILRGVSEAGCAFTTVTGSATGVQLAASPEAALQLYWREQARQVRVRGRVTLAGPAASAASFLAQSGGARIAGLVGRQSAVLSDPGDLARAQSEAGRRLAADPRLVAPDHGLYTLRPDEAEFWQGGDQGRHIRLRYRRSGGAWVRERLWP